jgi:hypothetical protein
MTFEKKNYPPEVWGKHFWFFIHTLTFFYPDHPNDAMKKKHYDFIHNLPFFIPHDESAANFTKFLDEFPLSSFLDSKKDFIKWGHFIHNKINIMLKKPELSFNDFYQQYYSNFNPKQKQWIIRKKYKVIILGITLASLIGGAIYFYTK